MIYRIIVFVLLISVALSPQIAFSASSEPEEAAQGPQANTTSNPNSSSDSGQSDLTHHETVVVTATRTETDVLDLPVSVGIVTRKENEAKQFNNLNVGEIVRDLPGVSVGHGNRNIPPWIHLRGTGYFIGRTLYMVDELPLAEPMVSIAVHPSNLTATEVLLGPSSSIYGANASGGVVNMRSASGRDFDSVTLGLGYGTFGTWRPQITVGKALGGWDFLGSYNLDDSKGYRNTDMNTGLYLFQNGFPSYLNSVNIDPQSYTNHYGYQRIGYRNDNGVGFTAGTHIFNEDLYGGKQNSYSSGNRMVGTGSFWAPISDIGLFTVRVGYQRRTGASTSTRGLQRVANGDIDGRFVFTPIDENFSYVYDPSALQRSRSYYTRVPVDAQFQVTKLKSHEIVGGITYLADNNRSLGLSPDEQTTRSRTDYDINQTAYFIQDRYKFADDRASILIGVRHDRWKYHDIFDMGSSNQRPPNVEKSATTYRGGFRYRINDNVGFRASAGTAFWPGAAIWFFQNLSTGNTWREANPNLKPEKTRMVDFGLDFVSSDSRTRLSVTPYWGRIIDASNYVYDQHPTLPGVQIIRSSNTDEVAIKGVELGFRQEIYRGLSGFYNHAFNKSEIVKSPINQGNQLRNAPDYVGSFGLSQIDAAKGYGVTFNGRYSGPRYYDDANTDLRYFHMRKYLTLGMKVWKDFDMGDNQLRLSLGVDNLANSKYDGEFIYNAPGRFYEVRLQYRFGM